MVLNLMSAIASDSTAECGFLMWNDHIRSMNMHILETTKGIRYNGD